MAEPTPEQPINLDDVDWASAVVCFTRCYACQFGYCFDPPEAHTWMAKEDAEHAGHPWPLPPEVAATNQCACPCAKPKETAHA